MENNKLKEKRLVIFEFVRIIFSIIVLYAFNIPIFIKIILIILSEYIDCAIPRFFFKEWIDTKLMTYQKIDKISDTVIYAILLFYLLNNGKLSLKYNYLIIFLFVYRLIGTIIFLIKNNRKYLFYFPNFFLEISLGIMFIKYFPILEKYKYIIFFIIIVSKLILEYNYHILQVRKDKLYQK